MASWIVSRTCSERSKTSRWSSAAPGGCAATSIGSQNSIRHRDGSGTSPSGPSQGKVGVIGTNGAPIARASVRLSPSFG